MPAAPGPVASGNGTGVENRCDFKQFDLLNILTKGKRTYNLIYAPSIPKIFKIWEI